MPFKFTDERGVEHWSLGDLTSGEEFTLRSRGQAIGKAYLYDQDQPFLLCKFKPLPAFEPVRHIFENEVKPSIGDDAREEAFRKVQGLGLSLEFSDGNVIDELLLHIDGEEMWFRY